MTDNSNRNDADLDAPSSKDTTPARGASDLRRLRHRTILAAALAGVIGLGGAVHLARGRPAIDAELIALTPTPIVQMPADSKVAAKGEVAEMFGNKFILQDASGRALVDLGPRGDDEPGIVHKGETLQVRGRFDRGVLHASILDGADGRRTVLGPPPPRPPRPDMPPRC